MSQSAVA